MTDAELRALVRRAVTRHLGADAARPAPHPDAPVGSGGLASGADLPARAPASPAPAPHFSVSLYLALENPGESCLIEPSVACNHCGYCKTHGH